MKVEIGVSLDATLGCGQAHRWRKQPDGSWQGVLGTDVVTMSSIEGGIEVTGCDDRKVILDYFRCDDDFDGIMEDISSRDAYVGELVGRCPGLRILRQDRWECLATYLLATNANVARIGGMVESVCDTFGRDLGGRHSFPTPSEILDRPERISACRLGYRDERLVKLAERTESGAIDLDAIAEYDYGMCTEVLCDIEGVGPKVADCVALFAFDHLEAFPVDARISKVMDLKYGVTGSYRKVADKGRELFGPYAGYAQEFLYHSAFI